MLAAAQGFDAEVSVRYPPWFEEASATLRPELVDDAPGRRA
jgi:hypothetical protein